METFLRYITVSWVKRFRSYEGRKVSLSAQIQPKSQLLFHKNFPSRDFSIMTLLTALYSPFFRSQSSSLLMVATGCFSDNHNCCTAKSTLVMVMSNIVQAKNSVVFFDTHMLLQFGMYSQFGTFSPYVLVNFPSIKNKVIDMYQEKLN